MPVAIAVIMTCYNRKEKTVKCLHALASQALPAEVSLRIYLMDDGSTDGTSAAAREAFPQLTIIDGDGNHFWNGGMRVAFERAISDGNYDFYLWLNDDTTLVQRALSDLVATYSKLRAVGHPECIVVGSIEDPATGQYTYGGLARVGKVNKIRFRLVEPDSDESRQCDTVNGNCVLIPASVAHEVGNLSPKFTHSMGDFDYGLRASSRGIGIWATPNAVGTCSRNSCTGSWKDAELSLAARYKKIVEPKGLPPADWFYFCRRHAGALWLLVFASPYLKLATSHVWSKLRRLSGGC